MSRSTLQIPSTLRFAKKAQFNNIFRHNESVILEHDDTVGTTTITSNQSTGTPGILTKLELVLAPRTTYQLLIRGHASIGTKAVLYMKNIYTGVPIHDLPEIELTQSATNTDSFSITNISVGTKTLNVRFGVLIRDPQIGSQFKISVMAFTKRQGLVFDKSRVIEGNGMLNTDIFNENNGEWEAVTTFARPSGQLI